MASNTRVDIQSNIRAYARHAEQAYTQALEDCVDDLVRTSSQSAPHDKGILEKAWSKEIITTSGRLEATVSYTVNNSSGSGNFNYALKMHEGNYDLGEKSLLKAGGTGMSGRTYPVGRDYLAGVLRGEQRTYTEHIERQIERHNRNYM